MIPSPRLLAVVTAMLLLAPSARAQSQFSLGELQEIDGLISSRDCGGLWNLLQANPSLAQGDDPLARELRSFSQSIERGALSCFSAGGRTASVVAELADSY